MPLLIVTKISIHRDLKTKLMACPCGEFSHKDASRVRLHATENHKGASKSRSTLQSSSFIRGGTSASVAISSKALATRRVVGTPWVDPVLMNTSRPAKHPKLKFEAAKDSLGLIINSNPFAGELMKRSTISLAGTLNLNLVGDTKKKERHPLLFSKRAEASVAPKVSAPSLTSS